MGQLTRSQLLSQYHGRGNAFPLHFPPGVPFISEQEKGPGGTPKPIVCARSCSMESAHPIGGYACPTPSRTPASSSGRVAEKTTRLVGLTNVPERCARAARSHRARH